MKSLFAFPSSHNKHFPFSHRALPRLFSVAFRRSPHTHTQSSRRLQLKLCFSIVNWPHYSVQSLSQRVRLLIGCDCNPQFRRAKKKVSKNISLQQINTVFIFNMCIVFFAFGLCFLLTQLVSCFAHGNTPSICCLCLSTTTKLFFVFFFFCCSRS